MDPYKSKIILIEVVIIEIGLDGTGPLFTGKSSRVRLICIIFSLINTVKFKLISLQEYMNP